jgi:hypothetical protein
MIPLGSEIRAIVTTVRDSLTSSGDLLAPERGGSEIDFSPVESPFVTVNGSFTSRLFVYGLSEYGGDDVVMPSEGHRNEERFYQIIR